MRVLLVDDHAIFREGLTSLLAAHHIDIVGEAQDGFAAFEQARALRPDVILMDRIMPELDGGRRMPVSRRRTRPRVSWC